MPTQATKPSSQVWKVSTAGDDSSKWWLGSVEAGRAAILAGRTSGRCYFEWSCPDDLDPTDEASWPVYHPAYGRTIGRDAMISALDQLGRDEFARAYGNQWSHVVTRAIPAEAWVAAADQHQPLPEADRLALGFDVAVDRSDASIVAGWRDELGVRGGRSPTAGPPPVGSRHAWSSSSTGGSPPPSVTTPPVPRWTSPTRPPASVSRWRR